MRAIAYAQGYGRIGELARAFEEGCLRHGVSCEVKRVEEFTEPEDCDVIWMYSVPSTLWLFDAYEGRAQRIIADLGYWRERASELPLDQRPVRISVESLQPDLYMNARPHDPQRFLELGLNVEPVVPQRNRILVCGHSADQAQRHGYKYGEWEAGTVARLRPCVHAQIVVREKPGNPPLPVENTARGEDEPISAAVRASLAVVCLTGNVGADAILHGVPVYARSGPGAAYYRMPLESIEVTPPLDAEQRMGALADIAYCQWTPAEFASGALWQHLAEEGLVARREA